MNEDDLYVEMSFDEYLINLKDQSGYYKVIIGNSIRYFKDSHYHRLNGPAWINEQDKFYVYHQNGKLHRLDGPAWMDKTINRYEYHINDKHYTKEEFNQHPDVIQYRLRKFQESMK